jgi:hypothetical protein
MIHIKDGVSIAGLKEATLDGLLSLAIVFHLHERVLVVTAGHDGVHKTNSLHYRGYAVDIRTRDVPGWQLPHLYDACVAALGHDWDVRQEGDHFHVEYDPNHDGGKGLP